MKLYFVKNKQFIGEIEIDEIKNPIVIWNDSHIAYDYDYYDLKSKNPSIHATYMFNKWVLIENELNCIYYDVNLNIIDITTINSIKCDKSYDFEIDNVGNVYLYKTQERAQDVVIYNIYFASYNQEKYLKLDELYVEPIKNTGTLIIYNDYGYIKSTFFHVNGKINGEKIDYFSGKKITNYVDGIKQGYTSTYDDKNNKKEEGYYLNDELEGDYIYYRNNSDISMIINYHLDRIYKVTKFFDDGSINIENIYNKDNILESHKSFYDNGVIFLEITITDNHDFYKLTHYFKNGQIAWKAYHNNLYNTGYKCKTSCEDVKELFDEDGNIITLDEFDKLYDKKQFKTNNIYDLFLYGCYNDKAKWSPFMDPSKFIY